MAYRDLMNRFSTTAPGRFLARTVATKLDPVLYRWSKGRVTTTGVPTIPILILTATGARSGEPRSLPLAYLADGEDLIVVASNFGQPNHPAWMYNLRAHPDAVVEVDDHTVAVHATEVPEAEKAELWPRLDAIVPQFPRYRERTSRDIHLFRLVPADGEAS